MSSIGDNVEFAAGQQRFKQRHGYCYVDSYLSPEPPRNFGAELDAWCIVHCANSRFNRAARRVLPCARHHTTRPELVGKSWRTGE